MNQPSLERLIKHRREELTRLRFQILQSVKALSEIRHWTLLMELEQKDTAETPDPEFMFDEFIFNDPRTAIQGRDLGLRMLRLRVCYKVPVDESQPIISWVDVVEDSLHEGENEKWTTVIQIKLESATVYRLSNPNGNKVDKSLMGALVLEDGQVTFALWFIQSVDKKINNGAKVVNYYLNTQE